MTHPTKAAAATSEARLVAALRSRLRGGVIDRDDAGYDEARGVWNGLIDRRPAVVARCADTADVVQAVRIAAELRPPVSVRGGGHQIAGSAVCDAGLVIDLSGMRRIEVDAPGRVARAEGGVTWGEMDRATQAHGLATPGGEVSTTGIGGFTLGGGMGLVMRRYGLACDNVRSLEVVTADGEILTVSPNAHPDLYWAACGAGRGLGVVTRFEFELHPIGPEVEAAFVFYRYEDAETLLRGWPDVALAAPETVTPQIILWSVPPDPSIPAELHGRKTVIVQGVYVGDDGAADAALAPLRTMAEPLLDASGPYPYLDLQSSVDSLFPAGGRYYMKSHFHDGLGEAVIRELLEWDARRPTPETLVAIRTLGGAVQRADKERTAFPHRDSPFNVSIDAGWTDPALDRDAIAWARGAWDALAPHAAGGVYINFSGLAEEADALRDAVYGTNRRRLDDVRLRYDPTGLFSGAAAQP
jgi:FAD/FMN-containing dehydrogenase